MSNTLKSRLMMVYGPGAVTPINGKYHKTMIQVDDRNRDDVYPGFCHIHVLFSESNDDFTLQLLHAPLTPEVRDLVQRSGGQLIPRGKADVVHFQLHAGDHNLVSELAKVIHRVTRRGQHYSDRNWKWICPRAAMSLDKLARQMRFLAKRQASHTLRQRKPVANPT